MRLVHAVGWKNFVNPEAVATALQNSLFIAVALDEHKENEVVGTVRVIGDGAIFFYVQDLMVLKEYRKQGIGTALMRAAMNYLSTQTPKRSYVGLFANSNKIKFYERFGFTGPKPTLQGMYKGTRTKPIKS